MLALNFLNLFACSANLEIDAIYYFSLFLLQIADTTLIPSKYFLKGKVDMGMMFGIVKIPNLKCRINYLALFNPESLICYFWAMES